MKKIALFILIVLGISLQLVADGAENTFWEDGVAIQRVVVSPQAGEKQIRARLDGEWQELTLTEFPPSFWEWNRARRHEYIDIFREMMDPEVQNPRSPQLSGPHNGIVATYGAAREDSHFKLNNAIKGMGFLPKAERLRELIELLEANIEAPMAQKLDLLDSLYANAEEYFASDRLVSLELYSSPEHNTQTFINQMTNPACVIVWMDIPTFKMKAISRLLDPNDKNLTDYEQQSIHYINLIHSFFHGHFDKEFIAVVYYAVEIYDSSPGSSGGKGSRIR